LINLLSRFFVMEQAPTRANKKKPITWLKHTVHSNNNNGVCHITNVCRERESRVALVSAESLKVKKSNTGAQF